MEIVLEKDLHFFPFEAFEYILKERLKEENKLIDEEIDNIIKSVIINFIKKGKTDKQIYSQLKFLGRKLQFGRVESLRYQLRNI